MKYDSDLLVPHHGFREQDFGELIGQKHEDITEHLRFIDGKIYAPNPPKGESIASFLIRIENAINNVTQQAIDAGKNNIVVFCHGGTIRAAHVAINKLDEDEFIFLDTPPLYSYKGDIS